MWRGSSRVAGQALGDRGDSCPRLGVGVGPPAAQRRTQQQVEREVDLSGGRRAFGHGAQLQDPAGVARDAVVEDLAQPLHPGSIELGQRRCARLRRRSRSTRSARPSPKPMLRGEQQPTSATARSRWSARRSARERRWQRRPSHAGGSRRRCRSSSSATSSSGPMIARDRCQVRRYGWSARTSASAACACCRRDVGLGLHDTRPHQRVAEGDAARVEGRAVRPRPPGRGRRRRRRRRPAEPVAARISPSSSRRRPPRPAGRRASRREAR